MTRSPFSVLLVGGLAAACADPASPRVAEREGPAPADAPAFRVAAAGQAQPGDPIPGQWLVVFRDEVADAPGLARRLAAAEGAEVRHTYQHAVKGFAARMSERAAAALARNPNVAYVEQDQVVAAVATQLGATWGLDRIDQRALPLGTTFTYTADGAGVQAYIVDTGILTSHEEFTGRTAAGYTAIADGRGTTDCQGHGTHVAGTVGGTTYGVAKKVTLIPVRVLDCNGSGATSGVVAGVDWVTGRKRAASGQPMVANMSLGGGASTTMDAAVRTSIGAGVTYALAAGNGNWLGIAQDACRTSPARVLEGLTVGATTSADRKTSWSNFGTCLDLFAPGASITSAYIGSTTATRSLSGTSMAAPHVAGVAALYLSLNPTATPAAVATALVTASTKNVVTSAGSGSPNRLLYTSY